MQLSSDLLLCYGWHAVQALLQAKPRSVKRIYLVSEQLHQQAQMQQIEQAMKAHGMTLCRISRADMDAKLPGARHQGICVEYVSSCSLSVDQLCDSLGADSLLLVLDGIQDPHNLGACLRTAWAAGVQAVIAPKDRAVGLTATVHQVACGAAACVPYVRVTNMATFLRRIKALGVWVYGATEAGPDAIYGLDLTGPTALLLGSEGRGLRALTERQCDGLFHIPTQSDFSTLNVSVATGVCLFEARRQRSLLAPT